MSSEQQQQQQQEEEQEELQLHYESNRYQERESCRECGSTGVYTRVYFHAKKLHSRWLCYNCADDYVRYRGYQLLTVTATLPSIVK